MLRELQLDVEQHGGQEISLSEPVPLPADAPLAHAGEDVSADVESDPEDLEDADEDDDLEDGAVITDADARTGSHAAGEAPRESTDGPAESAAQTAEREEAEREEAERSASQAALARLRQRRTD